MIRPQARTAIPALTESLKDENEKVRSTAAWALNKVERGETEKQKEERLEKERLRLNLVRQESTTSTQPIREHVNKSVEQRIGRLPVEDGQKGPGNNASVRRRPCPRRSRAAFLKLIQQFDRLNGSGKKRRKRLSRNSHRLVGMTVLVNCPRWKWTKVFGEPECVKKIGGSPSFRHSWKHSCSDGPVICLGELCDEWERPNMILRKVVIPPRVDPTLSD